MSLDPDSRASAFFASKHALDLQALQIWGTNFNYVATRINTRMAALGLPCNNRSHRQAKLKYKREERAHPKKVTAAINGQVSLCSILKPTQRSMCET